MNGSSSKLVDSCLAKPGIHQLWDSAYHTTENEKFFEQAFDYITRILRAPKNSTFLDAGCGSCIHSIRLADRGFLVQAVDFSESVLKKAEANVKAKGLGAKIKIKREDLRALSFENDTFKYVLCWGVLMHIPDLEKAISELARVLKPGGTLVISENNMYSLQAIIRRSLKRYLGKGEEYVNNTPSGLEYWRTIDNTGMLLTRHANIRYLIKRFKREGLTLKKRVACQFTDAYTKVSWRVVKNLIHAFDGLWFMYVRIPYLALGNIVILEKKF
jgi:2-polyprenyl-3-methyl-5-hydroxy-6-metoxy-1,4-benzoquinol methylase